VKSSKYNYTVSVKHTVETSQVRCVDVIWPNWLCPKIQIHYLTNSASLTILLYRLFTLLSHDGDNNGEIKLSLGRTHYQRPNDTTLRASNVQNHDFQPFSSYCGNDRNSGVPVRTLRSSEVVCDSDPTNHTWHYRNFWRRAPGLDRGQGHCGRIFVSKCAILNFIRLLLPCSKGTLYRPQLCSSW